MRGYRGDGWETSNDKVRELAKRIEASCADEHQGDVVAASLVLIAGVIIKNSATSEDAGLGYLAVVDQLATTLKIMRAN